MGTELPTLLRVLSRCVSIAVPLGFTLLSAAVLIDFVATRGQEAKKRARCPIATAAMAGFCACMYPLVRFGIGTVVRTEFLQVVISVPVGLVFFLAGTGMNIAARFQLGTAWSSRIAVYTKQCLVTTGLYSIVRHPLYSSLIMMLLGVGIIYYNVLVMALTALVFIPMMYFRARREEQVLREGFADYDKYQKRVPMFIPFARRLRHAQGCDRRANPARSGSGQ